MKCKHCRQILTPEGTIHAEGHHRGKSRCCPCCTGREYGLNADPAGEPCTYPCADAPIATARVRRHAELFRMGRQWRHCGHTGSPGEDHTCPCPHTDAECPDQPHWSDIYPMAEQSPDECTHDWQPINTSRGRAYRCEMCWDRTD